MTDAERRSVEDFYAHRAIVLKRIQQALEKKNMPKTASNLSEAFLAVREYLWDGTGDFANVTPKQETCICFAAVLAKRAKAITQEQQDMIESIVQLRLHPHNFVSGYMRKELNVNPTMKEAQMCRHGWLIKLSREFKDKE